MHRAPAPARGSAALVQETHSGDGPGPVRTLVSPQRHIQDPASQRLTWNKSPKSVLVIKKIRDASLLQPFKELCVYLMEVSRGGRGAGVRAGSRLGLQGPGPAAAQVRRLCNQRRRASSSSAACEVEKRSRFVTETELLPPTPYPASYSAKQGRKGAS